MQECQMLLYPMAFHTYSCYSIMQVDALIKMYMWKKEILVVNQNRVSEWRSAEEVHLETCTVQRLGCYMQ